MKITIENTSRIVYLKLGMIEFPGQLRLLALPHFFSFTNFVLPFE